MAFSINAFCSSLHESYSQSYAIANAVAQKLNTISGNSTTKEKGTPSIDKINSPKTKEERLKELKQFYDKQLITKEEYQEQKKKVLEE